MSCPLMVLIPVDSVCVRACVRAGVRVCVHTCVCAYIHVCVCVSYSDPLWSPSSLCFSPSQVIDFSSRYVIKALHTPGHTPESVVYLIVDKKDNNRPLKVDVCLFTCTRTPHCDTRTPGVHKCISTIKEHLTAVCIALHTVSSPT